MLSHNASTFMK